MADAAEQLVRGVLPELVVDHGELGAAYFSPCRTYRYLLTRGAPHAAHVVTFCMLNPSTADADQNDPTIAKCIKFAGRFARELGWYTDDGQVAVRIVNLFAIRATDPRDCFGHPKPVGGVQNDLAILDACRGADLVIAAWGAHTKAAARAAEIRRFLANNGIKMHRLGPPAKGGEPKHPLYLRDATALEVW